MKNNHHDHDHERLAALVYDIGLKKQIEEKIEDAPARETLFHEICHAFLEVCGMGGEGEGENEEYIYASNEKLTITMSRAMLMFTKLNPELSKELLYV